MVGKRLAVLVSLLPILMVSVMAQAGTSSYTYDERGRLTSYTPPIPREHPAVVYTYNNLSEKTSITSGSYGVQYEYFANSWLKAIKSGTLTIASFSYDAVGHRTRVDYGNGTYITYQYGNDARYLISSISHFKQGNQTPLLTISYPTRDNVGNPASMEDHTGQWAYSYDANNRLASAVPPNPVPDQPAGGNYGYDWVGNRKNPPASPNSMTHNSSDQITSYPGIHSYTYNGDGSLKNVRNAQGVLTASHTYTPNGLLESTTSNGPTVSRGWDGSKYSVMLEVGSDEYDLVYDITATTPSVIVEVTPTGTVRYFREPSGALIARVKDGAWRYYHFDELGSTRLLTNADGNVTDKYAYDAYGALLAHNRLGGSIDQPYQYVGRLGYYTHYQAPDFGLIQLGVRFYDPETGRFTQRDPVDDHRHSRYVYVEDSPTSGIDYDGRATYKIPIEPVSPFKICYRNLTSGKYIRHSYLLIDGYPIGYGPGGVGAIPGDVDDLVNGRANCKPLRYLNKSQMSCLRGLRTGGTHRCQATGAKELFTNGVMVQEVIVPLFMTVLIGLVQL